MIEITINLHMHTRHSDGTGSHQDIAQAALRTGLQAVIVTDHNILVKDQEGYYSNNGARVLVLVGEEIHDNNTPARNNHLLVFGIQEELAGLAGDTQKLIDEINRQSGLSFIAHPIDPAAPQFNQGDFSWDKWDVRGYTGIELWNGFSEFKTRLKNTFAAVWYAYQPNRIGRGPIPETLQIWDQLTSGGKQVVAVGGSDAHAMNASLGPLKKKVFPYEYHFKSVNTHLLLPTELTGDLEADRGLIYGALRAGHAYVGYDLPHPTRGFRFSARSSQGTAVMGDRMDRTTDSTLQIELPRPADCRLIRNGEVIQNWRKVTDCQVPVHEAGVYRVEAFIPFKGLKRGWIYSNPIYID
ncbi:MAG: CehA/McbA family metallohydrolase [Anaerolineales bacterium]